MTFFVSAWSGATPEFVWQFRMISAAASSPGKRDGGEGEEGWGAGEGVRERGGEELSGQVRVQVGAGQGGRVPRAAGHCAGKRRRCNALTCMHIASFQPFMCVNTGAAGRPPHGCC